LVIIEGRRRGKAISNNSKGELIANSNMTIKNKNNKPPVGGGATTTSNNNAVEPTINPFVIPMGERRRSLYERDDDGLDWLRKPSTDLPSNVVVTSSEISMLTPDGNMRVVDTYNPAERLREKQMGMPQYDGRYEGRSTGYPEDPDNFAPSGLKVRSTKPKKEE
jgi:hypothetical protein